MSVSKGAEDEWKAGFSGALQPAGVQIEGQSGINWWSGDDRPASGAEI
jgi:hypothetical protein